MANAPATLVKFRPAGPWRFGADSGARDRTDVIGHSDVLYSAITHAFAALGDLDGWLADTASPTAAPAVRFSSLFPFQGRTFFVSPPRNLWPPPSERLRFKGARFAPLALVQDLVAEQPVREDRWEVDPVSGCVIAAGSHAPFRVVLRTQAVVDRPTGAASPHSVSAIEFHANAGLWAVIAYASDADRDRWQVPLESALRYLGDTGIGGERSSGWGRSEHVEFTRGAWPEILLPNGSSASSAASGYWLLSLYNPAHEDGVTLDRGDYSLVTRSGRVDSRAGSGAAKRALRMIEEGSVVLAGQVPRGRAVDVAPEGFVHPVYRWGVPLSIAVPWKDVADRPLAPLVEVMAAPPKSVPAAVEPEPEIVPEPVPEPLPTQEPEEPAA